MAAYKIVAVNEDKRPLAGVVIEAIDLTDRTVSDTQTTGRAGDAAFTGLTGPHFFRPRARRTSGAVGGRSYTGEIEIQVVALGESACFDYVVEADGMGTHETLAGADGAFQAAIAAGVTATIWMCNSEDVNATETATIPSAVVITIVGMPPTHDRGHNSILVVQGRIQLERASFKVDSGGIGSGLVFRDIAFRNNTAGSVMVTLDTPGTAPSLVMYDNCSFENRANNATAGGYGFWPNGASATFPLKLIFKDCSGFLTGLWVNSNSGDEPNECRVLDSQLRLTSWWNDSSTNEGLPGDLLISGGRFAIDNGLELHGSATAGSGPHIWRDLEIEFNGSDALFSTGTGISAPAINLVFSALTIRFDHTDGTFGDFQTNALNQMDNLFIDDVVGYAGLGITPSGTFLTIASGFTNYYVGDIFAPDFGTLYAGSPPATGGLISTLISDIDGDTKVDVEESADEDIIRFDIAGTERMTLDGTKLDLLNGTYLDANDVQLPLIGSPTYTNVEQMNILFHSAGWFTGGTISKPGGVNIDVAAGTGAMRSSDSAVAQLRFFDWPASNGLTIPIDSIRYIGVELNDPNDPQVVVRTSDNFDHTTDFPLGTVVNEADTTLHVQNAPWEIGDHANAMIQRLRGLAPIARDREVGGIIFSETGTRNVAVTAGQLWRGLTPFVIGALDTNPGGAADTFDEYSSQGKENSGTAAWPNTLYDNGAGGTGTLQTVGNNKWANLWWYIELDGELVMVYGSNHYATQAQAEQEAAPSTLPNRLQVHGVLAARFIFQKSAGTAAEILSAFDTTFTTEGVTDHGNLAGLADDDHTNYFLADGTRAMSGDIDLDGNNLDDGGVVFLREQANADGDVGDQGQLWMKTGDPTEFMFTDDAGNDRTIIWAGGAFHDGFSDFAATEHVAEADIDHGTIAGLGDDDHTIYLLADGTRNLTGTLLITGANELNFRDAELKIYSSADGQLDIDADGQLELTAPTIDLVGTVTTDDINEHTADAGVTIEGVQLLDSNVLMPGYTQHTTMATPAAPAADNIRVFGRVSGSRMQLIGVGRTGEECIICDVANVAAAANILTLNLIE
jgi:hypothetical protein